MARETAIVAAMTALALLITALGTVAIVRFALRPLDRVAATAAEVATLPLDRDHHAITPRVPDGDTDPRTEVGLVGDTLNRLLDHVERALADVAASDRRMRQFITDASHELRTPLAAIHGYAELTRQDSSVLPETTEYSLARIEAEAQRMNSLVSDLLLLARLDEGQDLDTAEIDLTRRRRRRGQRRCGVGPDAPLADQRARRRGVGAGRPREAAPAARQPAVQRPGAHAGRHHGDDGHRHRQRR